MWSLNEKKDTTTDNLYILVSDEYITCDMYADDIFATTGGMETIPINSKASKEATQSDKIG